MNDEEFNQHLKGALRHPLIPFTISRLAMALRHVVDATGEAGATALRDWCKGRDEQDRRQE